MCVCVCVCVCDIRSQHCVCVCVESVDSMLHSCTTDIVILMSDKICHCLLLWTICILLLHYEHLSLVCYTCMSNPVFVKVIFETDLVLAQEKCQYIYITTAWLRTVQCAGDAAFAKLLWPLLRYVWPLLWFLCHYRGVVEFHIFIS